jgi:hypothetical protein
MPPNANDVLDDATLKTVTAVYYCPLPTRRAWAVDRFVHALCCRFIRRFDVGRVTYRALSFSLAGRATDRLEFLDRSRLVVNAGADDPGASRHHDHIG